MARPFILEPFVPLPGAQGPNAQTVLAALLRAPGEIPHHRVRWDTPDGDFLDLDRVEAGAGAPHVLILHGLEGSSRAGYVRELLRRVHHRGWGATALNFRSCSGEPNRLARSYNSGDTTDAAFVLSRLVAEGHRAIFATGFSLGGSVLLNLLAEQGAQCPLQAACAVSVPFDLDGCARLLDEGGGFMRLYRELFLASLKAKAVSTCGRHPGLAPKEAIRAARGIRAYDHLFTAPLFGFGSAEDYYRACSTAPKLKDVRVPTLLVTSEDDPFAPARFLPKDARRNDALTLAVTKRGGHVGFLGGTPRRPAFWAEAQAVRFFAHANEKLTAAPPPVP